MFILAILMMQTWIDMECKERCHQEDGTMVCESNWNDCKEV